MSDELELQRLRDEVRHLRAGIAAYRSVLRLCDELERVTAERDKLREDMEKALDVLCALADLTPADADGAWLRLRVDGVGNVSLARVLCADGSGDSGEVRRCVN